MFTFISLVVSKFISWSLNRMNNTNLNWIYGYIELFSNKTKIKIGFFNNENNENNLHSIFQSFNVLWFVLIPVVYSHTLIEECKVTAHKILNCVEVIHWCQIQNIHHSPYRSLMFRTWNSDSQHLYIYTAYPAVNEPPAVWCTDKIEF